MKKNITRRLTTALLAAVMCVSMAACGSKTDDTKTDGTGDADGAKKYTIGVCQLVTHDALDAATQGFIDAVKDKLGEENVTNDVAAVTTKAAADSDVIYIPTDNTAASCTETIGSIVLNAKTPVVAGEKGLCTGCGVATLSISYYDLGYKTGEMAAQVLTGEADIAEMPIQYAPATKMYNPTMCEALGITAPEGYEAMEKFFQSDDMPTGIYCANDISAIGMLKCLNKFRNRYYMPSIISSDDIQEAQFTRPMLTTVSLPKEDMGKFALYLLLDRLKGGHSGIVRMELEGRLMIRNSCSSVEDSMWSDYCI